MSTNGFRTTGPDPMSALHDAIVFNSRDFGEDKFEAWIYGIVVGWDDEDYEPGHSSAMNSVAEKVGWTPAQVAELRRLHANWTRIEAEAATILARPEGN